MNNNNNNINTKNGGVETEKLRATRIKSQWRFIGTLLVVVAVLAIAYAFYSLLKKQQKKTTVNENTISVQGVGVASAAPNTARVFFTVQTDGATSSDAAQANAQQTTALLKVLLSTDVASTIKTENYNIFTLNNNNNSSTPTTDAANVQRKFGFRAINSISVQLNPIVGAPAAVSIEKRVATLIDAATQSGVAVLVGGADFDLTDAAKAALMEEARVNAVSNARNSALVLAKSAQRALGGVQTMSDASAQPNFTPFLKASRNSSAAPLEFTTPISAPQKITVEASVGVVYALE